MTQQITQAIMSCTSNSSLKNTELRFDILKMWRMLLLMLFQVYQPNATTCQRTKPSWTDKPSRTKSFFSLILQGSQAHKETTSNASNTRNTTNSPRSDQHTIRSSCKKGIALLSCPRSRQNLWTGTIKMLTILGSCKCTQQSSSTGGGNIWKNK